MKTAAEYIEQALSEWPDSPVLAVQMPNALAAVQAALDEAAEQLAQNDKYHRLLARAIRNSTPTIQPPLSHESDNTDHPTS